MITTALVRLDVSLGSDKTEVIRALAAQVAEAGRTSDPEQLATDALAREATSATGLPGGIAIPHCRTTAVDVPTLAFARLSPGTDFGAKDGPADLAFLIAAPASGDALHLKVLTQLARALVKKGFKDGLRSAGTEQQIVDMVTDVVGGPRSSSPPPPRTAASSRPSTGTSGSAGASAAPTPSAPSAPAAAASSDSGDQAMITPALVRLDVSLGTDKLDVIRALAAQVADAGRTNDTEQLVEDAFARESTSATGLPGGIAIPHCRTAAVDVPTLAFARLSPPTDFGAKDGPADLAFLIAAPAGGDASHLKLLTQLARALVKKPFTDGLRSADTPEEVAALVSDVVGDKAATAPAAKAKTAGASEATSNGTSTAGAAAPAATSTTGTTEPAPTAPGARPSLVAVTACPTGIAHTYMAAEALEAAAERAGVELAVETQGSAGSTPLPAETIARAGAAIFAVDVGVRDKGRFAGKPLVSSGVKRPMDDADAMIAEALRYADDPNAPRVEGGGGGDGDSAARGSGGNESWGARTRRVLMTGVSYMIPFVAAGGLLIALSFLLGGYEIVGPYGDIAVNNTIFDLPDAKALGLDHALLGSGLAAYLGALFFIIGKTAFLLFIPALAGYIAYAIADRPGIAPGFVMGALAVNLFNVQTSAENPVAVPATGFLGAIVGGVLAGVIAHWIAQRKVPSWARGLMPVLVIPLFTSLIAGFLMLVVFGKPIGWLMTQLTDGLNSMSGSSAVLLGVILGLMMAFDMGGPLNKVAYSFAAAGVGTAAASSGNTPELKIMASVMLAGMVPPIALALATVVRPRLFTQAERENGKAGWLLGASFITEGAIPFAAADPLRVIPAMMLGSAVTGGLSQALDVGVRAPHGGIFVLFAVLNVVGYLLSLLAGVLVGCAAVVALKSMGHADSDAKAEAESERVDSLATV
jgi:PTS system fructose-specific IIC component